MVAKRCVGRSERCVNEVNICLRVRINTPTEQKTD